MPTTLKGVLLMALLQATIFVVVIGAIDAYSEWRDEQDYPAWFDRCMVEMHADVRACHTRWADLHEGHYPTEDDDEAP